MAHKTIEYEWLLLYHVKQHILSLLSSHSNSPLVQTNNENDKYRNSEYNLVYFYQSQKETNLKSLSQSVSILLIALEIILQVFGIYEGMLSTGDGNCLFASLSYLMMDQVNILRTIVVDNMIGKLKVTCNIYIVNKLPMNWIHTIRDMTIDIQYGTIKCNRLGI